MLDFREKTYEGVNALSALTMAVFDRCGLGDEIADAVRGLSDQRILSVPSVVKMIIGSMSSPFDRVALSRFEEYYASAPVDMLFGDGVTLENLNGTSIARALDILYSVDLADLSWRCSERCTSAYGLSSDVFHIDATNTSVYTVTENVDVEGAPTAMFGGNSKSNRNDLRQYDAMGITDGNRVLGYLKAYSGNTSDAVMDAETLEFLSKHVDPKVSTCVADCKIVNEELVRGMYDMGMGFISKCPQSFSSKVRDDIIHSVRSSFLEESSLGEGYGVYDTDAETVCGTLRFIGYRTPKDRSIGIRYLREQGDRLLSKAFTKPLRTRYHCRDDAIAAAEAAMASVSDMGYRILIEAVEMEEIQKRSGPGRPRKGSPPPEVERFWKLKVEWMFDEVMASELIDEDEIQVIITNIPRTNEDSKNIRYGATADTVLRCYLDEYKPEYMFRLLKSGIGMDKVYLHKGSRVAAMMFIAGVAGTMLSIMDELLRRGNADTTTYQMKLNLCDTTVRVKRSTGYMYLDGHPGVGADMENYCRIFDIEPESMLGH